MSQTFRSKRWTELGRFSRSKWETGKTQYVRGALWDSDIGSVFRSSLYRLGQCLGRLQLEVFKTKAMCRQDGFVSIYVPEGAGGTGEILEKGNNFTINTNINELFFVQDIARYPFW